MAQFLKAKFLSQALEWKFKHPFAEFYAGLRYEFIIKKARETFKEYNKYYSDNKQFVENFVKDLHNSTRNKAILKTINPEVVTSEYELENSQFEIQAQVEQQQVAQLTNQPQSQPFSFSSMPAPSAPFSTGLNYFHGPDTPESEVKLALANKSGAIVGEATITPTSTTITGTAPEKSTLYTASSTGQVTEERTISSATGKVTKVETPGSRSILTDKNGNPLGERSIQLSEDLKAKTPKSELIHATSTGATKEAPPKQITLVSKSGAARIHNIKTPSFFKTFASNTKIFARKALSKIAGGIGKGLGAATPSLGRTFYKSLNILDRGINSRGAKLVKPPAAKKNVLGRILGGILGLFLFLIILFGSSHGPVETFPEKETAPKPPVGAGPTDLKNCKFTRAGSSSTVKSSILLGWINTAATAAGIPPQALASVAMHENQDFTANATDDHDAIKSGQFCNKGKQFCEDGKGHVLHSKADAGQDDPCAPYEIATGARTAQAVGLMQLLDIYNPGKDLCSINENLNIAAAKLKADGLTAQPTQNEVNQTINSYYNSCTYGTYSYCDEVWQDLQNCKSTSQTNPGATTGIINAAAQITPLLYQANPASSSLEDRLYHNKTDEPGLYYWCTYLVVDAYNKAGFPRLDRSNHGAVVNMKSFFANDAGYQLLPSTTPAENLRPGDVIFFEGSGDQHTSLVKSIEVSQEGNGVIRTYEANNVVLEDIVFVQNHQATAAQTTANKFSITGFGEVKTNQQI